VFENLEMSQLRAGIAAVRIAAGHFGARVLSVTPRSTGLNPIAPAATFLPGTESPAPLTADGLRPTVRSSGSEIGMMLMDEGPRADHAREPVAGMTPGGAGSTAELLTGLRRERELIVPYEHEWSS